jgi:hypothetical protein
VPTSRLAAGLNGGGSGVTLPTSPYGGGNAPVAPVVPPSSKVAKGPFWSLSGTTIDAAGAALGGCTVHLFRTADDVEVDVQVSTAAGAYKFDGLAPGYTYYVVAFLSGSPDRAGTTLNTLVGS